jgi:hypothetical protein
MRKTQWLLLSRRNHVAGTIWICKSCQKTIAVPANSKHLKPISFPPLSRLGASGLTNTVSVFGPD